MLRIRRILFPTDFTGAAEAALGQALLMAVEHGASLDMLHARVLHADDPHDPRHRFPEVEDRLGELGVAAGRRTPALAGGAEAPALPRVRIRREIRRGIAAAPVILEYAEEEDVDLIAMGTHGRRLGRMVLGSVASEVVRLARCPVLTVRPDDGKSEPGPVRPPRRLLVPVDFSEHSATALRYGLEMARGFDTRVHVFYAVAATAYPDFYYPLLTSETPPSAELRRRALEELEAWVRRATGAEGEVRMEVGVGRPTNAITERARAVEADLIVLASHGRTGLERILLGSVAEEVIRRAPVPVLTVKSYGRSLLPDA